MAVLSGTSVTTADGSKRIDNLRVGEYVSCAVVGRISTCSVLGVSPKRTAACVVIATRETSVTVSPYQLVSVSKNHMSKPASLLKVGDEIKVYRDGIFSMDPISMIFSDEGRLLSMYTIGVEKNFIANGVVLYGMIGEYLKQS